MKVGFNMLPLGGREATNIKLAGDSAMLTITISPLISAILD